jgi:hypothetical protein
VARIIATVTNAATRPVHPRKVAQLGCAVGKAGDGAAGRTVLEVELVLAEAIAGADRVDRHPDLHAEAAGEGEGCLQRLDPQRPLAGDRRFGFHSAEPSDRPAGEAEREAEAAADPA